MNLIHLLVVEDEAPGYDNLRKYMAGDVARKKLPGVVFDPSVSKRFEGLARSWERLKEFREAIQSHHGPTILVLDFDLDLDEPRRVQVKEELERILGKGVDPAYPDSIPIGVDAISNPKISPLLIVLATGKGGAKQVQKLLRDFVAQKKRERDVQVVFAYNLLSLGLPASEEDVAELLSHAYRQFLQFFGDGWIENYIQELRRENSGRSPDRGATHEPARRD